MLKRYQQWKKARRNWCRIDEEWQGLFIGRRLCLTHNVVWDDGGSCPRIDTPLGQPFAFARDLEGSRF